MRPVALFRVDASAAIGSGHLSRCLTLARALRGAGSDAVFAMRAPTEASRAWVAREGHRLIVVDGDEITASRAAAESADLVVVDSYVLDRTWHEALRAPGRTVCVIDDLADRPICGDVVVNGNVFAERLRYDVHPEAVLLVGPSYALVRDEFLVARGPRTARPAGDGRRLLVTMGGSDPTMGTELALDALERLPGSFDVRIVVGGGNPRAQSIAARAEAIARHAIVVCVDVTDMAAQMLWADVALTAAGSTCLELSCVGVAAVTLVLADNQAPVAEELAARGMMIAGGHVGEADPDGLASAVAELAREATRRRAMEDAQRATVDGRGAARVAKALGNRAKS